MAAASAAVLASVVALDRSDEVGGLHVISCIGEANLSRAERAKKAKTTRFLESLADGH